MPFDKLYVKIKCTVCDGTRVHQASGHHDPMNIFKWKECPYCDRNGHYLIEAGEYALLEYFAQLDEEERERLLQQIAAV